MKRVFVTGASGFVGTYLINQLMTSGWDVAGYDWRVPTQKNIPYFAGDNHHGDGLSHALKEFQHDFIFHLAGVLQSEKPETFYNVHVLSMLALSEAIMESGLLPSICVASSSAVYDVGVGRSPITASFQPRPVLIVQPVNLLKKWLPFGVYGFWTACDLCENFQPVETWSFT